MESVANKLEKAYIVSKIPEAISERNAKIKQETIAFLEQFEQGSIKCIDCEIWHEATKLRNFIKQYLGYNPNKFFVVNARIENKKAKVFVSRLK